MDCNKWPNSGRNYHNLPRLVSSYPIISFTLQTFPKINFSMASQKFQQRKTTDRSLNEAIHLRLLATKRAAIMMTLLIRVTPGKQASGHQVIADRSIHLTAKQILLMGFRLRNRNSIHQQYPSQKVNLRRYFLTSRRSMRASRFRMSKWKLSLN